MKIAKPFAGLDVIVVVVVVIVIAFSFLFMIPTFVYATPISDVNQPDQGTTICPDGSVILAVMECPNPTTEADCPPNQFVIISPQTGDCIAVPTPFECPNGVLAPTQEQCNISLTSAPPSPSPPTSLTLVPPVSGPQSANLSQVPTPFENVGAQQPDQVGGGQDDDDDSDTQSEDSSDDDDDDDSDSDDDESNEDESNNSDDDEGDDGGGELD